MSREEPASYDLVVATLGRIDELERFLHSVEAQRYPTVRVLVVDQNEDDRVEELIGAREVPVVRLVSPPGLSRARNLALRGLEADLVAFPDDDCAYPAGLLERVAERFAREPELDGLAGRAADEDGQSSASWKTDGAVLTGDNLWNRANAATIFLRRRVVERAGAFDEELGLGSRRPWSSGEETDYLIRAVRGGARIEYDPTLVVLHPVRVDDAPVGLRDGASMGYLLRKHGYPWRVVARMLVRPVGGAALAAARLDLPRSRYYAASFAGRVRGYFGASRSKS